MTENGVIYIPPDDEGSHGILKIDTKTDVVTKLNVDLLPEQGGRWYQLWSVAIIMCSCSRWMHLFHTIRCSSNYEAGS